MKDQKNIVLAVVLSAIVLIGWEYFYAMPMKQRQEALPHRTETGQVLPTSQSTPGQVSENATPPSQVLTGALTAAEHKHREAAIASVARIPIDTPRIKGSIALKGGRIDDVSLTQYHDSDDPTSPAIVLLSPPGSPQPFYAEFGWVAAVGANLKIPGPDTVWRQLGSGSLSPGHPITLAYDNGERLLFQRTITVDDKYLFTLRDEVTNNGATPVTLHPYGLVSRHGTPRTPGRLFVHEGLIGVMGDQGAQEVAYDAFDGMNSRSFNVTNAWLGFTDQYWAATLLPDTNANMEAHFSAAPLGTDKAYQTDYLLDRQVISPGATGSVNGRLFAGVKEAAVVGIGYPLAAIEGYNGLLNLNHFDLLIDWGWFHFIIKPMFLAMEVIYLWTGNFGVAILIVTILIKIVFFPFANQSYRAMIEMRRLQPQIAALRDRFPEQGRANMEIAALYKRENVTAPSGCLPIIIQTLAIFSIYKILFVAVEARTPFFGWIQDLAAPDTTNVLNLFGLIAFDPTTVPAVGSFLHLGALPIILGLTIWQLQRKISPILLGSFRRKVYAVLPFLVMYVAADMTAAMLIYFIGYNCLSILHQLLLMKDEKGIAGDISEYSAKILPYGKIQPIVFLTMLAPILQNLLTVLVFWRRSRTMITQRDILREPE